MTDIGHADATIVRELHEFIAENYLYMHPGRELGDDEPLLESGIIDSLGFVELVDELERRYGISVVHAEMTDENFGSVAVLARFVAAKRAA